MKCIKCNKKSTIILPTFSSCNSCFIKIIDKRIRKEMRLNNFLKNKEKTNFILIDNNTNQSKFLKNFFKNLIKYKLKKMNISYQTKNYQNLFKEFLKNNFKIILPFCLEEDANYFFECVLTNKKPIYFGHFYYKKTFFFKPLLHVSEKEILSYLKLKKIPINSKNKKTYLNKLEKKFPEINFSLIKSAIEINLNT